MAKALLALGFLGTACGPIGLNGRPEPRAPVPVTSRPDSPASGTQTPSEAMALDGKTLYENLCSNCHGTIEQTMIARTSLAAVQTAITNVPDMKSLPDLSTDQIQSLVEAVEKIPPGRAKAKP